MEINLLMSQICVGVSCPFDWIRKPIIHCIMKVVA